MSNDLIRQELREYLISHGVMQIYVCDKCSINPTTLNQFILGKRNIGYKKLLTLHQYLIDNGVIFRANL